MNKLFTLLLCCMSLTAFTQQPNVYNDPKAKTRTLNGSFTKITVSSGIELILTQSNELALATSVSDEKYETMLRTDVENGVLKIWFDMQGTKWVRDRNRKLKVYLSCKTIESIKGSSGATVKLVNEVASDQMSISFGSGAKFTGKLQVKTLNADVNSGAEINVTGTAHSLSATASSGASFRGYGLTSQDCEVKVSSGANLWVEAEKKLWVNASSGGQVKYKGNAVLEKKSLSSGGTVKHE
jgi:Putative auto-transporter adhesin, head GIN domain